MLAPIDVHYSILSLLVLAVVGVLIMWFIFRRGGFIRSDSVVSNLPASAPLGSGKSRWIETILLFCVTGIIFVFTATNTSTGGYLLMLDELNPAFASVNLTVAVCTALCLLLSVLVCLFRRTSIGVIFAAVVLCGYGWVLNGAGELLERMAGEKAQQAEPLHQWFLGGTVIGEVL